MVQTTMVLPEPEDSDVLFQYLGLFSKSFHDTMKFPISIKLPSFQMIHRDSKFHWTEHVERGKDQHWTPTFPV